MTKPTLLLKSDELQVLASIEYDRSASIAISGLKISKSLDISIPYCEIGYFVNELTKSINRISDLLEVQLIDHSGCIWKFQYDHVELEFMTKDNKLDKTVTIKRGEILALAGFLYDYMEKQYHV